MKQKKLLRDGEKEKGDRVKFSAVAIGHLELGLRRAELVQDKDAELVARDQIKRASEARGTVTAVYRGGAVVAVKFDGETRWQKMLSYMLTVCC